MGGRNMKAVIGEVLPCAAMVLVEGCIIGLTIMAGTAMARGMSPFVFVVYTNALGSIILLPFSFFYHRDNRSEESLFTIPFLLRVFFLGLIGITIAQNLAFVGLSYSSPIVACGMANQIPALTFILGIILRKARFDWRRSGSKARLIGSLISLGGAVSITLYKGPTIRNHSSPSLSAAAPRLLVFSSPHENWVLGCLLFAASSVTLTIWNFVQVGTVKMCSQVMKIISFYSLFGTVQSALLAFFLERDPNAWRLHLNFELLIIILTVRNFQQCDPEQCSDMVYEVEGPLFCARIQALWNSYASTFGSLLFPDTFHYGSMMGAFICGVGYYTVFWGQIKDEETHKSDDEGKIINSSTDDQKVPLLQEDSQDDDMIRSRTKYAAAAPPSFYSMISCSALSPFRHESKSLEERKP
ncbi:UNVERIFIED_CONTAM: WAT1-related protein [Sesamum calycinum]|uniref:WAT1-related protein n=1 Tax=Sesamum calycinum TaxID=2727403 RepID=A0AAW2QWY4_9LAMI